MLKPRFANMFLALPAMFLMSCIVVVDEELDKKLDAKIKGEKTTTTKKASKETAKKAETKTAKKEEPKKAPTKPTKSASKKPPTQAQKQAPAKKPSAPSKSSSKKKEKPFEEVTKDHDKIGGMFNIYKSEKNFYVAVKPDQFSKNFLVMNELSKGIGSRGLLTGWPMGESVVRFEKRDKDKIDLYEVNHRVVAPEGTPTGKAIETQYSDSLIKTFKIATTEPETDAKLINIQSFLTTDTAGISRRLGNGFRIMKEATFVDDVRNFPKNTEINVTFRFQGSRGMNANTLADSRYVTLGVHTSLLALPEKSSYRPRLEDPRVGYFTEVRRNFDMKHPGIPPLDRFIIRWNLEKADPEAKLSPPKKPITFWIENTTPYEYRAAVKEGIETWNKAFEAAGFQDAVQAVIMPDDADWDPADARYAVIRWLNSGGSSFAGMGPARTNPLTGEIIDADVMIEGEAIRGMHRYYERYVTPVSETAWEIRPAEGEENARHAYCGFGKGLKQEANLAVLSMLTRGVLKAGEPVPEDFVHGYIVDLVSHEVGHVLGLRHNFRASTLHPADQLHNEGMTKKQNLVGSVMDYNGINVAPPGAVQGEFFPSGVGPYDIWAIEYGYTPIPEAKNYREEVEHLNKIASRSADPTLAYATDEDTWGISYMSPDPRTMTWDLGKEPLEYCRNQMALIKEQIEKFPEVVVDEGESFSTIRSTLSGLLGQYARHGIMACKYIGGIYMERNHKGDPDAVDPFRPVSAAKQREALEFLKANVFSANALHISPATLRKTVPDRRSSLTWGRGGSMDFDVNDRVLGMQRAALGWLFNATVLDRILNNEHKFTAAEEPFTLPELFENIEDAIWSADMKAVEASTGRKTGEGIGTYRRALQRSHVQLLTAMLYKSRSVPEDAKTQAWASLSRILTRIDGMDGNPLRGYTEPHLRETKARIQKALDAHMQVRAD